MLTIKHPLFKKAGFPDGKVAADAILRRPHVKQADFLGGVRDEIADRMNMTARGKLVGTGLGALAGAGVGAAAHYLAPPPDTRNIFQRMVGREQPRGSLLDDALTGAAGGAVLGGAAGTYVGTGRDRDQRRAMQSQIAGQRGQLARQAQLFGSQAQGWGQRLEAKRGRANQMEYIARQQAAARLHQQRQMQQLAGALRQQQAREQMMYQRARQQMMQPQGQTMQPQGQMVGGPSPQLIQMYNWRP